MNLLRTKPVVAVAVLLGTSLPGLAAESIVGQVVHALTGSPLRRVTLTTTRVDGKGEPATAQVDENGQFVFRDLAPGGYLLAGERNGFDRQFHGARSNPNTGTVLPVLEGQPITGLVFRLFPTTVISGRVLDSDGEPLPNVMVRVHRRKYVDGKWDWYPVGGGGTDDRGEYRLSGLRAGRYLVSAADVNFRLPMISTGTGTLPEAPELINVTTYYPGATRPERAEPVAVARGEDRRGVDIQLIKGSAVRIRGRITGAAGGMRPSVNLLPRTITPSFLFRSGSSTLVQPGEWAFEINGVRPGSYILMASAMGGTSAVGAPLPIEVGERNIDGVELTLSEGFEIAGRVLFEGGAKGTTVRLVTEVVPNGLVEGEANERGEFKLKGVFPGQFRLRVADLPLNAYLKTVKLNGQVINPGSVSFPPGAKLEILLGKASAELKGVVLGLDEKPFAGATVVFVPESGRDALYRTATSDHDGAFLVKGVAPGRYKVLAWEDLEPDAYRDPEVVKPVEDRAALVALEENGRGEVTLKIIPTAKD